MLKFYDYKLNDFKCFRDDSNENDSELLSIEIPSFSLDNLKELSETDRNTITYIGGYIAYNLGKGMSCVPCKQILTNSTSLVVENDTMIQESDIALLHLRDRGGLKCPSDFIFVMVAAAFLTFNSVKESEQQKNLFYTPQVASLLSQLTLSGINGAYTLPNSNCKCDSRRLAQRVIVRAHNIFLKNFARENICTYCPSTDNKRRKFAVSR